MISAIRWTETDCVLPYRNLAAEKALMDRVRPGECVLFLWQNRHTVVIGRNQDARAECRVDLLQADGGYLARRLSGGGAVYHDAGNLNFSFLVSREDEDPARQSEVILRAVRALGIPAGRTGRNDLETEGRKFSGHAWYRAGGRCCHHGTLMMDVDLERMSRYLTASPAKLRNRSVASVRSRVMNLRDRCPGLDRERLSAALIRAFGEVYGLEPAFMPLPSGPEAEAEIRREAEALASDAWLFPERIPFTAAMEARFPWGGIRLELAVDRGRIRDAVCRSDAMDEALIREIGAALAGCAYTAEAMVARLAALRDPEGPDPETPARRSGMIADVGGMIRERIG